MHDGRKWWRAAAVFGVLTIATAIWFLTRPMPTCGGAAIASPMLDFELATARNGFATILDCAPRRAELDFQNIVDLLLFMWVYTGFLAAFSLAAGVRRWLVLGLAALMLGGDFVETAILRQIAAGWPQLDSGLVSVLAVAVRLKFVAIAAATAIAGAYVWRASRLIGALAVVGGIASLTTMLSGDLRMAGSALLVVAWLAMTIYAAVNALRSRRPAPSSAAA